ncbi:DUF2639 domain-containing protein [Bacillus testis]|nr:DUF2639 domain-containing protein [Bacillus testis]
MAYKHSKGWYVAQLRERGIKNHPVELKKLQHYRTHVLRNLYFRLTKAE